MQRMLFAFTVAAVLVTVGHAAQSSQTALCDTVATAIRSNPKITTGTWQDLIFPSLRADPRAQLEVADQADFRLARNNEREQFLRQFHERFTPSDALVKALGEFVYDGIHPEVFSLTGSELHAVMDVGGTMNCETFLFFRTPTAGPSQPVDDLPRKDAQDDGIYCYGDAGQIGRVSGQVAFIEQMNSPLDNRFSLRVVPWRDGRWAGACTVDVQFKTSFEPWRVYADKDDSLLNALRIAAPELARRVPPALVSDRDLPDFQRVQALARRLPALVVPTFGAPVEDVNFNASERWESYPLILEGQTYLMALGNVTIGWRDFPDKVLILYSIKEQNLAPVASAIVKMHRDGIESVRVTPGR